MRDIERLMSLVQFQMNPVYTLKEISDTRNINKRSSESQSVDHLSYNLTLVCLSGGVSVNDSEYEDDNEITIPSQQITNVHLSAVYRNMVKSLTDFT